MACRRAGTCGSARLSRVRRGRTAVTVRASPLAVHQHVVADGQVAALAPREIAGQDGRGHGAAGEPHAARALAHADDHAGGGPVAAAGRVARRQGVAGHGAAVRRLRPAGCLAFAGRRAPVQAEQLAKEVLELRAGAGPLYGPAWPPCAGRRPASSVCCARRCRARRAVSAGVCALSCPRCVLSGGVCCGAPGRRTGTRASPRKEVEKEDGRLAGRPWNEQRLARARF